MSTFRVHLPTSDRVPILFSVPHCGTYFPPEIAESYHSGLTRDPDDTDYFVDRLYDFAADMGITMIAAVNSRWVIDLNRSPEDSPLYSDGRLITGLCPVTTFLGDPLYRDGRQTVAPDEVTRRKRTYYEPYHNKLEEILTELTGQFGKVLLWDCHSIRQHVPTIYPSTIPDMILGDADGQSASQEYSAIALEGLRSGPYSVEHNRPFKGGYITRHFGKPQNGVHALQLELTKCNYMDDTEKFYAPERADKLRELLRATMEKLAIALAT